MFVGSLGLSLMRIRAAEGGGRASRASVVMLIDAGRSVVLVGSSSARHRDRAVAVVVVVVVAARSGLISRMVSQARP